MKILLVEDNPGDVLLLRTMLSDAASQYSLYVAERLAEAETMLQRMSVDIILLDLHLPDSSLNKSMQRVSVICAETPVLILTSLDDEATALCAVKEGAQDYLIKGDITPRSLIRSIRHAIERKRIQEDLRRTQKLLLLTQESSPVMPAIVDRRSRWMKIHPGLANLLGHTGVELAGCPVTEFLHVEDKGTVTAAMMRLLSGERTSFELEVRFMHLNGNLVWTEVRGTAVREEGEPPYLVMHIRDITDRKRSDLERESLILQLQSALAEVKKLGDLLPICAGCRKIRNDQGYWQRVEEYFHQRLHATFTHSLCPECFTQNYPDKVDSVLKRIANKI